MATELDLEIELATFHEKLPSLLAQKGKFVLIHSTQVIGVFDTHEEALRAGYENVGLDKAFFVKEIQATEQPQFFSRSIRQCPT